MFVLYNLALTLLSPFWVPWMLWRANKRKQKPNWAERQGQYPFEPNKERKRIWLHAVSVGEVMAALPVLRELRLQGPELEIILSTTTSSGHQTASERAKGLFDKLVYFPIDVPRFQLAAMQRVQPKVVAIMETELWFNFLWAAKVFGARTLLVNGRISDRSFARARLFGFFYRAMLRNMDRCLMQSEGDSGRIRELGAKDADVFGNTKFDEAIEGLDADPAAWMKDLCLPEGRFTVVIGSTRGEEEEKLVLDALEAFGIGRLAVVHAPRHLERVPALAESVQSRFGSVALRSKGEGGAYVILDTYGELAEVYALADAVVIGGGFENLGGQNLLQPLAHGKPVIHGPHMQNFRSVAEAALAAGAARVCATAEELRAALEELASDSTLRGQMGQAAEGLVRSNVGASKRYAQAILEAVGA